MRELFYLSLLFLLGFIAANPVNPFRLSQEGYVSASGNLINLTVPFLDVLWFRLSNLEWSYDGIFSGGFIQWVFPVWIFAEFLLLLFFAKAAKKNLLAFVFTFTLTAFIFAFLYKYWGWYWFPVIAIMPWVFIEMISGKRKHVQTLTLFIVAQIFFVNFFHIVTIYKSHVFQRRQIAEQNQEISKCVARFSSQYAGVQSIIDLSDPILKFEWKDFFNGKQPTVFDHNNLFFPGSEPLVPPTLVLLGDRMREYAQREVSKRLGPDFLTESHLQSFPQVRCGPVLLLLADTEQPVIRN